MDGETEKMVKALPHRDLSVLEVSGNKWEHFGFNKYRSVQFPEFDICSQALSERFDLIIAEQVFEHLVRPYSAAKIVYEMLNPSGRFLITTPFLIKIHPCPEDCTRWTETGIKYFLAESGFAENQIATGSWGNVQCLFSNLMHWTRYNRRLHSLENQKDLPLVVWALAKK